MLFTRGTYHDYDNWAKHTGDERWSYNNSIPYFRGTETWDDPSPDSDERGRKGKIRIVVPSYSTGMRDVFNGATQEAGLNFLTDINSKWEKNGEESCHHF
jgi:choline dehydrogenase-like flavoprotein